MATRLNLKDDLQRHFDLTLGRGDTNYSRHYLYQSMALAVRDQLVSRWRETRERYRAEEPKRVSYLSLEFLMGRTLHNALSNLQLEQEARDALQGYACSLEELETEELDAGLGNGGLGRLAACFLDSCATLEIPVTGYGIRYQFGMFHQKIVDGHQQEAPDQWLREGNPWEVESPENTRRVPFFGRVEVYRDEHGREHRRWVDTQDVLAIPYDIPIPGYKNDTVNTLRLWSASATEEFNLGEFNSGSYTDAVSKKTEAEQITMVLYPNDASEAGKVLRLRQQYFLASASLQDILHRWVSRKGLEFSGFAEKNAVQLNDTHPTVAVAELMRLLMDQYGLGWDDAWAITESTMAYTNHTLLPEALETWSVSLFEELLPRLLEIIYEINARFLAQVALHWPGDVERQARMSIIQEDHGRAVRMAHLAIVGSFSVNGVAALHTDLLKQGLFADFYALWPEKFNNKTNGVTPRRWLANCNPGLRDLITESIGDAWIRDLSELEGLAPLADDVDFQNRFMQVKQENKNKVVELVRTKTGVEFDPTWLFDVQVKRIHEYKRQLLNILHVIALYDRIRQGDTADMTPRCVLIGGKAAPGYAIAKLIIKLINNVANTVNNDEQAKQWLRVAFVPNYNVSSMEIICPGTDLSEQISTAGKEASGTGNMKFMMNGALTIGTLDGANIEIREAVGEDNFFLFGLTEDEVAQTRSNYQPNAFIEADPALARALTLIQCGHFSLFEPGIFDPIIAAVTSSSDPWMTAADFSSYRNAQTEAAAAYQNKRDWARMAILNTAMSGRFSSDRTIAEYRDDIWYRGRNKMS